MRDLPIAITCGDPAGVGPEIIQKWLLSERPSANAFCVIGAQSWVDVLPSEVQRVAVGDPDFQIHAGSPSKDGAQLALEALEEAASGCLQGRYAGVVTAPTSKSWLAKVGCHFPGQTEFFADRWGGSPTMAFAGGQLCVVLATWHIPLMQVAQALTEDVLQRAVDRADFLARALGASQPRIGVCGLNPHAGEEGLLGDEERDLIDPVLDTLRARYPGLSKALPGDTVFRRQLEGDFDSCIAMYHDQGLAPVKTLEFDQAVNITLGLPWVRTSPDHGTAFAIAGKGQADERSFANAAKLAKKLIGKT